MVRLFLLALGFALAGFPSAAAQFDVKTAVSVSADAAVRGILESCLKNGIRKLPNVSVWEPGEAAYNVKIVVVGSYSASLLFSVQLDWASVGTLADAIAKKDGNAEMRKFYRNYENVLQHYVLTDSTPQSLCSRVVAQYDTDVIEPMRQWYQKLGKK